MQTDSSQCESISGQTGDKEATSEATKKRQTHEHGVRPFDRPNRRSSPFAVEWRVGGKRKTEWYSDVKARDARVVVLRREARLKTLILVPTRDELTEWQEFRSAIGNADWRDVVAGWKQGGGKTNPITIGSMVERYLADQDERLASGDIALVTHKKNCPKAKAFAADFSTIPASRVTAEDIEEWIDDLGFEAAETFNTYRKVVHAVFEHGKKECPLNPVSEIKTRDDLGDVGIITVGQTKLLFDYAVRHEQDIVPRLALEAFAGLRFSSAFRLERADINFADKGVLLPAHKLKTGMQTGRRHYLDGLPKNLWSWLKFESPATWALTPRNYRRLKSKCFTEAEVPHPHNCLRHGFCTYHVAAFKEPGLTATILCHRNQELLWSTYNGRATQADGKKYFSLTPPGRG